MTKSVFLTCNYPQTSWKCETFEYILGIKPRNETHFSSRKKLVFHWCHIAISIKWLIKRAQSNIAIALVVPTHSLHAWCTHLLCFLSHLLIWSLLCPPVPLVVPIYDACWAHLWHLLCPSTTLVVPIYDACCAHLWRLLCPSMTRVVPIYDTCCAHLLEMLLVPTYAHLLHILILQIFVFSLVFVFLGDTIPLFI